MTARSGPIAYTSWVSRSGLGVLVLATAAGALQPASARARPRLLSTHERSYATSLQLGIGDMRELGSNAPGHPSINFAAGPKFYNGNWTGPDPPYGLYVHPSIGFRAELAEVRRRYAEFALEVGAGPCLRDGSNTWTLATLGYRVAGLAGSVDRGDRPAVYSTGLRHGPVLGLFAGVLVMDVSHEVVTRPDRQQGLRVGVSIELNPLIWLMTTIW